MDYKYRDKIAELGQVARYHGNAGPIQQTIAAHSWGVAWLIAEYNPAPSVMLIKAALEHDLPEALTSDVSYISKQRYPLLKQAMDLATEEAEKEMGLTACNDLDQVETAWLKWADLLEGALWCRYLSEEWGFPTYRDRWKAYSEALAHHIHEHQGVFPALAEHFTRSVSYSPLKGAFR